MQKILDLSTLVNAVIKRDSTGYLYTIIADDGTYVDLVGYYDDMFGYKPLKLWQYERKMLDLKFTLVYMPEHNA